MKPLTPKERKAVELLLAGKSKRQAIAGAYNVKSVRVADVIAQQVFKRDRVINSLQVFYNKQAELVPKALKVIENILDNTPEDKLKWDTQGKTALALLERISKAEETNAERGKSFLKQIIDVEKAEKDGLIRVRKIKKLVI